MAWRPLLLAGMAALLFAGAGCGSDSGVEPQGSVEARQSREGQRQRAQRQAALRRAHAQARREAARQRARRARHERERRARRHRARVAAEEARAEVAAAEQEEAESSCDPSYSGACLNPASSDYDCEGGSGDGPDYTGTVTVVGEDHYGLDADGDGTGCEPY